MPRMKAAKLGVGEVALPIIASTATTLAAFFLYFVGRYYWKIYAMVAHNTYYCTQFFVVCGIGHQLYVDFTLYEN